MAGVPGHGDRETPGHNTCQVVTIALLLLTTRVTTGLAQGQEDLLKPLLVVSPTLGLEDECPRGGWHGQGTVI